MHVKALLSALVLAALPGFAFAGPVGCSGDHGATQAMSCVEGTQWDEASGTCVPLASS
jgi:hypothetical protein